MEEVKVSEKKTNNIVKLGIIIGVVLILIGGGLTIYKSLSDKKENGNGGTKKDEVVDNNKKMLEDYPYLMVTTARYGATEESKEFIAKIFGDNSEEKFRIYFQWYNVVHELTHGIIMYNGDTPYIEHLIEYNKTGYIEEQKVNDFAVAYWKKYGDPEKVQLLQETVNYIVSSMTDPTGGTLSTMEYGKQIWESGNPAESFEKYGWFQFNIVKEAFEKDLTLEDAFKNLGLKNTVTIDDEKLSYEAITDESCDQVIKDTAKKFKNWGLSYPEIYHVYDDDPNNNSSAPITEAQYKNFIAQSSK